MLESRQESEGRTNSGKTYEINCTLTKCDAQITMQR